MTNRTIQVIFYYFVATANRSVTRRVSNILASKICLLGPFSVKLYLNLSFDKQGQHIYFVCNNLENSAVWLKTPHTCFLVLLAVFYKNEIGNFIGATSSSLDEE